MQLLHIIFAQQTLSNPLHFQGMLEKNNISFEVQSHNGFIVCAGECVCVCVCFPVWFLRLWSFH